VVTPAGMPGVPPGLMVVDGPRLKSDVLLRERKNV